MSMNPILVLREELVCLIILVFLLFTSKSYQIGSNSKVFSRLSLFAVIHVIFDIISLLTVNSQQTVSKGLNDVCHVLFYMSAVLYSNEIFNYVVQLCYPRANRKIYLSGVAVAILYLFAIPLLNIEYHPYNGTWSSTGSAAFVGYGVAFLYFIASIVLIITNIKRLSRMVGYTLLPMMIILILTETVQIFQKELLFTGGAITIVTVGFFFSLENPVRVFERRVMTDALTGVGSRHCYERDMEEFEKSFREHPQADYIFVFCDINNLKAVNGQFGHQEGDRCITLLAQQISAAFLQSKGIYRMGGDEFLAIYVNTPETTVNKEIRKLRTLCEKCAVGLDYEPSLAIGYAVSSADYASLKQVLRTADYMMYKNKADIKRHKAKENHSAGARLNLTALTDRIFEAMCSSNDRTYPYITNMETGVSRISPAWADYFGLGSEFLSDFHSIWTKLVHPDDLDDFLKDLNATISGEQVYHNSRYRARNPKGEYVLCSCHGSIYHGQDGTPDIFAGYMVNHGIVEYIDPLTGLRNFVALAEEVKGIDAENNNTVLLNISFKNFSRLDMLYRYEESNSLRKSIAEMLREQVKDAGEVFCQDGTDYIILFHNVSVEIVTMLYSQIRRAFSNGNIGSEQIHIPLETAGGATRINSDCEHDFSRLRSILLYAVDESRYNKQGKLVFYDDSQLARTSHTDFALLSAIHHDAAGSMVHFVLQYQPILNTETETVIGAEALVRWNSPVYGMISPAVFIDFLESDPCFYQLGLKILEQAIADTCRIRNQFPDFRMNVNITALQLIEQDFIQNVEDLLQHYKLPCEALILELTERCKEMEVGFLKERIEELRSAGIKVAFDDMGTGYSTLNLLLNISVDEIKLDTGFVHGLMRNTGYSYIAQGVKKATDESGGTVCFEGVQDRDTLDYIRTFGASLCQGYYFSKPLLIDALEKYLMNKETV